MWSRREFLQHATFTAAAGLPALRALAATNATGPLGRPIGIQLWTVREVYAKDPEGTLRQLAAIGFREIEFPGGPPVRPAPELRRMLDDLGLVCPAIHAGMSELQSSLDQKIELARALGAQYLICAFPWTADSRFGRDTGQSIAAGMTLEDWRWNAEQLNRAGERARQAGIRCGYHNHNMEFRSIDGVVAFDELLRLTDPALVTIELDIGWVVTGGADPVHYLKTHADRIALLHVKDVRRDLRVVREELLSQTTELGAGKVDWPALFAAANPAQLKHYFYEQENFERPPLESARISFEYLSGLRVAG